MIRPVVGEGFFLRVAPRGRSALVCVFETDYMINVDEVTGFVSVEAYELGADGVIGIDLDYSEISGKGKGMLFLVASGTAVKFKGESV